MSAQQILDDLYALGVATDTTLANRSSMRPATVRRILRQLVNQGVATTEMDNDTGVRLWMSLEFTKRYE